MEPGPAVLFTDDELNIPLEPALDDDIDRVDVGELAQMDQELGPIEQAFNDGLTFLQSDALNWQSVIDDASGTLDTDLADSPAGLSQELLDNRQPAQDAIDGAESSFLADAYQDAPPWFQPASTEIPEDQAGAVEEKVGG